MQNLDFQIFIIWDPRKLEFPPTLMYKHETPITSFPLSLFTDQLISKTIKGCAQCTKLALLRVLGEVIDRQTYPELPFLDILILGSQKKKKKKNCNTFFILISYTHLVCLAPTTSVSTLLLQGEEMPFDLEPIGWKNIILTYEKHN